MYPPLTREFLLRRGYCCDNDCKNCPYKDKQKEIMNTVYDEGVVIEIQPCKNCGNDKGIRIETTLTMAECTVCHKACTIKDGMKK